MMNEILPKSQIYENKISDENKTVVASICVPGYNPVITQ